MSPFKSKSQQRYMFARHPKIAKRSREEIWCGEEFA